jgi:hypothetical protein
MELATGQGGWRMLKSCFVFLFRVKVDLTKYVEQHSFTFDEVFDVDADNQEV